MKAGFKETLKALSRKAGFKPSRQPLAWGGKRTIELKFTLQTGKPLRN